MNEMESVVFDSLTFPIFGKPFFNDEMQLSTMIYLITSIVFFLTSVFATGSVDLRTHDSYAVLPYSILILFIGGVYLFFGVVNWGARRLNRKWSRGLEWIHYFTTTVGLIALFGVSKIEGDTGMNDWLTILVLVIALAQFVFIVNFIRALIFKGN